MVNHDNIMRAQRVSHEKGHCYDSSSVGRRAHRNSGQLEKLILIPGLNGGNLLIRRLRQQADVLG